MSVYLEIGIVIIFVFLILSLLVTAITEMFASIVRLRARVLRNAIIGMISKEDFLKKFYDQSLLIGANPSGLDSNAEANIYAHPSYIRGKAFSRALLLSVLEAHGEQNSDGTKKTLSETELDKLKGVITKIKHAPLKNLLLGLLDETVTTTSDLELAIEKWFDASMERLSGQFKRYQQWISFGVGLILAVLINIDVIRLSADLYEDDALRTGFVAQAEAHANAQPSDGDQDKAPDKSAETKLTENLKFYEDLKTMGVGWPSWEKEEERNKTILFHIPGWLLAAFASVLGAPFWFDLLSRFVRIRGTGNRPDGQRADSNTTA